MAAFHPRSLRPLAGTPTLLRARVLLLRGLLGTPDLGRRCIRWLWRYPLAPTSPTPRPRAAGENQMFGLYVVGSASSPQHRSSPVWKPIIGHSFVSVGTRSPVARIPRWREFRCGRRYLFRRIQALASIRSGVALGFSAFRSDRSLSRSTSTETRQSMTWGEREMNADPTGKLLVVLTAWPTRSAAALPPGRDPPSSPATSIGARPRGSRIHAACHVERAWDCGTTDGRRAT